MKINVEKENNNVKITLEGRLDSTTAGEFEEVINSEVTPNIDSLVIDLEGIDYVSSKGLRILVGAYRTMNGKPMTITNPNESVHEVLRLSGLLKAFNLQ